MGNARLDESQPEINIARRNINSLKYADFITLIAESEEELKSLLMGVKKEYVKCGCCHPAYLTYMQNSS